MHDKFSGMHMRAGSCGCVKQLAPAGMSPGSLLVTVLHKASRHHRGQERCSIVKPVR